MGLVKANTGKLQEKAIKTVPCPWHLKRNKILMKEAAIFAGFWDGTIWKSVLKNSGDNVLKISKYNHTLN
jgi:hypothetical protein